MWSHHNLILRFQSLKSWYPSLGHSFQSTIKNVNKIYSFCFRSPFVVFVFFVRFFRFSLFAFVFSFSSPPFVAVAAPVDVDFDDPEYETESLRGCVGAAAVLRGSYRFLSTKILKKTYRLEFETRSNNNPRSSYAPRRRSVTLPLRCRHHNRRPFRARVIRRRRLVLLHLRHRLLRIGTFGRRRERFFVRFGRLRRRRRHHRAFRFRLRVFVILFPTSVHHI